MLRDRLALRPFDTSGRPLAGSCGPRALLRKRVLHYIARRRGPAGRRGGKPHGLGGVPRHAAAAFAHHPQVILTTRIAGFRVGLSGLVCRENVAALFSGFGGSKIGAAGPDPQHEEDDCDNIRHCGPRLMLAARSKLLWFESKFRPMLYLPPPQ